MSGWAPIVLLALMVFVANGRKVVVSGYDGECEQKTDCQSCLHNGGICVWVVAQKMTSDYDYCANFSRLHFRYGQSYLLYNMVWCSRIFEEDKAVLPGEAEIAVVDEDGVPVSTIPMRAWVAIVFTSIFAATGIAGAVWFWFRYNRLRLVHLGTQSRQGSVAGDVRLNSIRQRSSSAQSSVRQGNRRGSRPLSPIQESNQCSGVGSSQGDASNNQPAQVNKVLQSGCGQSLGSNTTGSMSSFMQPIPPMPLLNAIPSNQPLSFGSFMKYPFGTAGMGLGQDTGLTLSRNSSKRSASTSTSTLELNTISGGRNSVRRLIDGNDHDGNGCRRHRCAKNVAGNGDDDEGDDCREFDFGKRGSYSFVD